MKRSLIALATLASVVFGVQSASAQTVQIDDLKWEIGDVTQVGGKSWTVTRPIKVGTSDTTATFGTQGWFIPANNGLADSLVIGWIEIVPDSSVAVTGTMTGITCSIDVGNPLTWTSWEVPGVDLTANDTYIRLPILLVSNTQQLGKFTNNNHIPSQMRLRIVAVGGVLTAARVRVIHYVR
jgi:hypothetical protein